MGTIACVLRYSVVFFLISPCAFSGETTDVKPTNDEKMNLAKVSWEIGRGKYVFVGYQKNDTPDLVGWKTTLDEETGKLKRVFSKPKEDNKTSKAAGSIQGVCPARGVFYPKSAKSKQAKLTLEFPRPANGELLFNKDNPQQKGTGYRVLFVSLKEDVYKSNIGFSGARKGQMEFIQPMKISVPISFPGVKVYTVPYMKINGVIKSVLVVVADDKKKIQKIVKVTPKYNLDWSKWFHRIG